MIAKYLIFGFFLIALAWGAFCLAVLNDADQPPLSYDPRDLAIRLMVLPGYARSDCFLLGLNGDGSGWFRGRRDDRRGSFEFAVSEKRIERLHRTLYEMNVFWMDSILPPQKTYRLSSGAVVRIPYRLEHFETTHLDVRIGKYRKRVTVYQPPYAEIDPLIRLIESTAVAARWSPVADESLDGPLCIDVLSDPTADTLSCRFRNDTDLAFSFKGMGGRPDHLFQYLEDGKWRFKLFPRCGTGSGFYVSLPGTVERFLARNRMPSRADTFRIGVPVCYRGSWNRFVVWSEPLVASREEASTPRFPPLYY